MLSSKWDCCAGNQARVWAFGYFLGLFALISTWRRLSSGKLKVEALWVVHIRGSHSLCLWKGRLQPNVCETNCHPRPHLSESEHGPGAFESANFGLSLISTWKYCDQKLLPVLPSVKEWVLPGAVLSLVLWPIMGIRLTKGVYYCSTPAADRKEPREKHSENRKTGEFVLYGAYNFSFL